MSLTEAFKLRASIRKIRSRHTTFVIVPIRWLWLQLLAAMLFLGGATWAGFKAGGADLNARAKEAVANYFTDIQGGMTEEELRAKLVMIDEAAMRLGQHEPLGQIRKLEAAQGAIFGRVQQLEDSRERTKLALRGLGEGIVQLCGSAYRAEALQGLRGGIEELREQLERAEVRLASLDKQVAPVRGRSPIIFGPPGGESSTGSSAPDLHTTMKHGEELKKFQ